MILLHDKGFIIYTLLLEMLNKVLCASINFNMRFHLYFTFLFEISCIDYKWKVTVSSHVGNINCTLQVPANNKYYIYTLTINETIEILKSAYIYIYLWWQVTLSATIQLMLSTRCHLRALAYIGEKKKSSLPHFSKYLLIQNLIIPHKDRKGSRFHMAEYRNSNTV